MDMTILLMPLLLLLSLGLLFGAFRLSRVLKTCLASGKTVKGYVSAFVAGLCAIAGAMLLLIFAGWAALEIFGHGKTLAERTPCQNHIHQLDWALQAHCYPPVDSYPTNLANINAEGISAKLFTCPESGNSPGDLTNVMEWTDYIYVSGAGPAAPAEMPVLICPPMFHNGVGWNALIGDHSCTWYLCSQFQDPAHFDKLIEDPLAFCPYPPPGLRSNIYVHVSKRIEEQSKGKYRSHGLK